MFFIVVTKTEICINLH